MATESCVLALDLGTTSTRALVVNARGTILGRAARPLTHHYPAPGWLEQDPNEFLALSIAVLQQALARARLSARDVLGIGIVSQRSTAIAWDCETGQPLAPAIGWQDRRNQARVDELVALGIPINTLASATKFEWMLNKHEAIARAAERGQLRLGTPDVWLTDRLSRNARFVTDPGHAACTGLYDANQNEWWPIALGLFGVDASWLPEIVNTGAIVAETRPEVLGQPVPIAARAGDQQASTFAQGVVRPGMAKLTLGTSAMLNLHVETPAAPAMDGYYTLPLWSTPSGQISFCVEGTVITAGASIEWLCELGLLSAASELDTLAESVGGTDGVVFVPALQGLGSPFLDVRARGLLLGLTRGTAPGHIARAVLQGIAQRCIDLCDPLPLANEPLRVDGGLARSNQLMHALADLGGRAILRAAEAETTALGAAHFAGLATGLWATPEDAFATVGEPECFEPQLAAEARTTARDRWQNALARARSHD